MMKIKKFKKIGLSVLAIFFLMFNLLVINGVHSNIKLNAEIFSSKNSKFYPNIEQFVYNVNQQFTISFIVESNETIKSINYESDGFMIIDEPYLVDKDLMIGVKYDGVSYNPTLVVEANLTNGDQIRSKIYAIVEGENIYINANSFDAARDIYLSEMLANGTIDECSYEELLMENKSFPFVENLDYSTEDAVALSNDSFKVEGLIQWEDDWGNIHPLQYTKVSVFDKDNLLDDNLGTIYTNENGKYSFTINKNVDGIFADSGRDIYIKIWPEGKNSVVKTGNNNNYVIRTDTIQNVSSDVYMEPITIEMNDDLGRAFQISQAVITASRYVSEMNGSDIQKVKVRYPHNEKSDSCFYRSSNDTIFMVGNSLNDSTIISGEILRSYASWDVIMHEYGHFVQDKLNLEDSPGGTHWTDENMYDHYMQHCNGVSLNKNCNNECAMPNAKNAKDKAIKLTYAEAWPSVFGAMVQQYYINLGQLDNNIKTLGNSYAEAYNGVYENYNAGSTGGEAVESSIIGVLWDLYDNDSESHDNICLGHKDWWYLTVTDKPKTFSEVAENFYSLYTSYIFRDNFDCLLEYYDMAPSDIKCKETLVSHSEPTFLWNANGTSLNLKNNKFYVLVFDSNYSIILDFYTENTSFTLSLEQWNSIISAEGEKFYIKIGGYQTDKTATGIYYSAFKEFSKPQFKTSLSNGLIQVIGYYSWTPSNLTIKSNYNGISVTTIGASAFENCSNLTHIKIPNSVTNVDSNAFLGCENLKSINLSLNLYAIGTNAFANCSSLEYIYIPDTVQHIDNEAFKNCLSLRLVEVLKEEDDITHLGEKVFDGCYNLLQIIVPKNRLAEYQNKVYWSSYKFKIVPDDDLEELKLNCYSNFDNQILIESKYNKLYELNVNCAKNYKITSTANYTVKMKLYDSNMDLVTSGNNVISYYLGEGVYFLDIRFVDNEDSGLITTTFKLNWPVSKYNISLGDTNVLSHLHEDENGNYVNYLYLNGLSNEGFYKITITGYDINGEMINIPAGAIKVYNDSTKTELVNSYSIIDENKKATNLELVNELIVYLSVWESYYIDISLPNNEYYSLNMNVSKVTENIINLFDLSENTNQEVINLSGISNGDDLQKIELKQAGQFILNTQGFTQGKLVILKQRLILDGEIIWDENIITNITDLSNNKFNLVEGTYFIGYVGANLNSDLIFKLTRVVTSYGSNNLEVDPYSVGTYGSEVTLNEGALYSNVITQGFTRIVYLSTGESRLDYYWYSSDENAASITNFGTVIGQNVSSDTYVKIMAVNIEDPSKVYVKEFLIKKDTKTLDSDPIIRYMTIEYDATNDEDCQINLSSANVPINWLQYYTWTSSNSYLSVDKFGRLFAFDEAIGGTFTITGKYKLNSRVEVYITVIVK